MYNNPANPHVLGIDKREIEDLFPGVSGKLKRITLAPPLAKYIPDFAIPVVYPILSAIPFMCTHYLGL